MGRIKRIFGLGSFYLSDGERKEARKYLKAQLRGDVPQPIENLTLSKYFELIKEIELAFSDENGISRRYGYEGRNVNFRDMSAEDVARRTLDGRQMFHSDYGQPEGILADYDHDCSKAFKWWIFHYTQFGHPWETSVGNFNPYPLWKSGYNHKNVGYDKKNTSLTNGFFISPVAIGTPFTPCVRSYAYENSDIPFYGIKGSMICEN